jgi:hypothetical protein
MVGGLLFGAVRRSELWGDLNAELLATGGLIASCLAVYGLLALMASTGPPRARRAVAPAMVPVLAGVIVAAAIAQLAILLAGFLAGTAVLARPLPRAERRQVAGGLSLLAGASVIALASH